MTAAANDAKFRALAVRFIGHGDGGKFGRTATYTEKTPGTYDHGSSSVVGASEADFSIRCSPRLPVDDRFVPREIVSLVQFMVFFADSGSPLAGRPKKNDVLTMDGQEYKVLGVKSFESGQQFAVHALFLER
jgi:hypothetical protein